MKLEEIEKQLYSYSPDLPFSKFEDLVILYRDYFPKLLTVAKAAQESVEEFGHGSYCSACDDNQSYWSKLKEALEDLEGKE